jgi:hypothetical protein
MYADFPEPPSYSDEEIENCRKTGDFIPLLFEWYQYVGSLASSFSCVEPSSPAYRQMPRRHHHVLVGLLNRCARLMLANVALSHEGRFGETTVIVDRCIFESAVKLMWLCNSPSEDKFARFLADGLKTEIEFKGEINSRREARGSDFPIEARMLASIGKHMEAAELTEQEVQASKRLPPLSAMMSEVGMGRLAYVISQRIGSHHIHGTWPSLLFHYLKKRDGNDELRFGPRDHDCPTDINQFMSTPTSVLRALLAYADYAFIDETYRDAIKTILRAAYEEIMEIYIEEKGGRLGN